MHTLNFKKITDIAEARAAWEALTPDITIVDNWDFRYLYYQFYNYPLAFYAGYYNDELVGVLPLQNNTQEGYLEFFGGGYFDDNSLFVKAGFEDTASQFFAQIQEPAYLQYMKYNYDGVPNLVLEEDRYFLDVTPFTSYEDYIEKMWQGKSRQNLRAQIRKIYEHEVVIQEDNFSDFDRLIELNKERFGAESSFFKPHRADFFRAALNKFDFHLISISIDGKLESVGISVLYNGTYHGINSGTSITINGLGKFLALQKIGQSIKLGAKIYDANVGELGWKEAFHFSPRPQYMLDLRGKS